MAAWKQVKLFFEGTPSGHGFSTFSYYKVYEKNRVQLKTSLWHIFKGEIFDENGRKAFFFKPQPFSQKASYTKFQKRNWN